MKNYLYELQDIFIELFAQYGLKKKKKAILLSTYMPK